MPFLQRAIRPRFMDAWGQFHQIYLHETIVPGAYKTDARGHVRDDGRYWIIYKNRHIMTMWPTPAGSKPATFEIHTSALTFGPRCPYKTKINEILALWTDGNGRLGRENHTFNLVLYDGDLPLTFLSQHNHPLVQWSRVGRNSWERDYLHAHVAWEVINSNPDSQNLSHLIRTKYRIILAKHPIIGPNGKLPK